MGALIHAWVSSDAAGSLQRMESAALGAGDRRFKSSHPDSAICRDIPRSVNAERGTGTTQSTTRRRKSPARAHRAVTLAALLIIALLTALAGRDADSSSGHTLPSLSGGSSRVAGATGHRRPTTIHAGPSRAGWSWASISHYADTTDGYLGRRTSCGLTTTLHSNWAAALTPRLAHCGLRLTICHDSRCVRTTIEDVGAMRRDDRTLDAANGLYHALCFHGVARIRVHTGWSH